MDPHPLKELNALRREGKPCVMVTDLTTGRNRHVDGAHASIITGRLGEVIQKVLREKSAEIITVDGHDFFIKAY